MGILVEKDEERSKLGERISSDLRERAKKTSQRDDPDFVEQSEYRWPGSAHKCSLGTLRSHTLFQFGNNGMFLRGHVSEDISELGGHAGQIFFLDHGYHPVNIGVIYGRR